MEVIQLTCSRGTTETQVYLIANPVPNLHTTCKEKNADITDRKYLHLEGNEQRRNSSRITESQGSAVSSQPRKEKEKGMRG